MPLCYSCPSSLGLLVGDLRSPRPASSFEINLGGFTGGSQGKESAVRETRVRSLGREDPLEKEMATHSSILAWKIPWIEEPGRLQSTGSKGVGHN